MLRFVTRLLAVTVEAARTAVRRLPKPSAQQVSPNGGSSEDYMMTADAVLSEMYRYSSEGLSPIIAKGVDITFDRDASREFMASVRMAGATKYHIRVSDGLAATLVERILSEKDESVSTAQDALSRRLFNASQDDNVLQSLILHAAILFVVLHEVSHIICGHFIYQVHHGFAEQIDGAFHFSETTVSSRHHNHATVDSDWLKLVELEADEIAFDTLRAISYEVLRAGDEFRARLTTILDPDNIPHALEVALGEAMLCAAAAVCFLVEAHRREGSRYPLPETRVISLAHLLVTKLVFPRRETDGREEVPLEGDVRTQFNSVITSAVLNALEFGRACVRDTAADDATTATEEDPTEVLLSRDLVGIFTNDGRALSTKGALEFAALQGALGALRVELKDLRSGFLADRSAQAS